MERERAKAKVKAKAAAIDNDDDDDDVGRAETKEEEEEESLGIKLRKKGISLGKRVCGPFTPVPSWKMMEPGPSVPARISGSKPTARELGASLWEAQDLLPLPKMSRSKTRPHLVNVSDASEPQSLVQPQSAARLIGHIHASFDQQHKLSESTFGDLKPESPSPYNSLLEEFSLNHAVTPSSSLDLKRRLRDSEHSIKTSAELIKVLNRIWTLEEKLASNVALVKSLKMDLRHAQSRIQEMMHERQAYRDEMDELMNRVSEDRVTRKSKEQERIRTAVQSIKDELEDEKKLRRRSEGLHRKLGRELSEMKSAFNKALNDLESERKARGLLEDLCDEFANGLGEYEQEMQNMNAEFGKDTNHILDQTLHDVSKVWMDERLQMKIAEDLGEEAQKNKILERLAAKITSFFQERRFYKLRSKDSRQKDEKNSSLRHHSLESFHLNGAVGAPQDAEDDDSEVSELHCFELNMHVKGNISPSHLQKKNEEVKDRLKGKSRIICRKGQYFEKIEGHDLCRSRYDWNGLRDDNEMHLVDSARGNSAHTDTDRFKVYSDIDHSGTCNPFSSSSHITPIGNANASGSGDSHNLGQHVSKSSRQHTSSDLDLSNSSSKFPQTVKENSLKEKLLEARLEGRNARLRALKGSVAGIQ